MSSQALRVLSANAFYKLKFIEYFNDFIAILRAFIA